LSANRLLEAYQGGLFPWFSDGQPVLWWSPDPRMVLFLDAFKLRRSLVKRLRAARRDQSWTISLNRCFERVMRACAEPRPDQAGTWITEQILDAYGSLHRRGLAHSVEVWRGADLIGGLYGVAIGRMFYGESMFARESDSSKCALAALVHLLRAHGFVAIDCQQNTAHLGSLGAREISRAEFLAMIGQLTTQPAPNWCELAIEFPQI
jgi:leucyl/phenylalanyl-tRNA--protein transferase